MMDSFQSVTMTLFQLVRDYWVHLLVPMGFALGCYLDKRDDEKLTAFRNKSMLFQSAFVTGYIRYSLYLYFQCNVNWESKAQKDGKEAEHGPCRICCVLL
ncbi:hypothetical protein STEG23_024815 [Scotinomys teguina]